MSFLSLTLWLRLGERLTYMVYPPYILFFLFGCVALSRRRRQLRMSSVPLFLLAVLALDVAVRFGVFFVGRRFNHRYFMFAALASALVSGYGLSRFDRFMAARLRGRGVDRPERRALATALGLVLLVTVPKILRVPRDKVYIPRLAEAIRSTAQGRPVVVWITERNENRIAYLSRGQAIYEEQPTAAGYGRALELAGAEGVVFLVSRSDPETTARHLAAARVPAQIEFIQRENLSRGRTCCVFRVRPATG